MSEAALVTLVTLIGWLVLMVAFGGLRGAPPKRVKMQGLIWAAILVGAAIIFSTVNHG